MLESNISINYKRTQDKYELFDQFKEDPLKYLNAKSEKCILKGRSLRDGVCITKNNIPIFINYFTMLENEIFIHCNFFNTTSFLLPNQFSSKILNYFKSDHINEGIQCLKLKDIANKAVCLFDNVSKTYTILPLTHTDNH